MTARLLPAALILTAGAALATTPEPKFRAEQIDRIQIGYGLAIADVDGDKRPDIILADKAQIVWYQNPGTVPPGAQPLVPLIWRKHVIAENLTKNDNVCVAAQDIDGDGKCEIAVGAEWNPGDTVKSGAVFYLVAPEDRTKPWEAVKFPSVEPTTHRMRWIRPDGKEWGLAVVPLHGRGNKNNEGAGAKALFYHKPADPHAVWPSETISDAMHATHNFAFIDADPGRAFLLAGKEGIQFLTRQEGAWKASVAVGNDGGKAASNGVGEVRSGTLKKASYLATVEPMHGNTLAVYVHQPSEAPGAFTRRVLTDKLIQGHALACGDLLGSGSEQIVVGWRGNAPGDNVGIRLWTAADELGQEWRESVVDDNQMACEDLQLADLDGDGDLEIVASGRATKNVVIYWNETTK